jgi:rubrerythrin
MKNYAIKNSKNQIDGLTDALVNVMCYSDSSVDYPSFDKAKPDDGVMAEWFYPVYKGQNDFSELSAINMYTSQEAIFEEVSQLMLGIALTEMKHYGKLSDFLLKIGGRIDQRFSNSDVSIGKDLKQAISIAITAEEKTIEFYEKLESKLLKIEVETETIKISLQFISKLIADEKFHLNLLKEKQEK